MRNSLLKQDEIMSLIAASVASVMMVAEPFIVRALWRWYVVPVTRWPALTLGQAFGLEALVCVCTYRWSGARTSADYASAALNNAFNSVVLFALGWLVMVLAS
jgi:hypothetical protein